MKYAHKRLFLWLLIVVSIGCLSPNIASSVDWINFPPLTGTAPLALAVLSEEDFTWVGYDFGLVLFFKNRPIYFKTDAQGLPGKTVTDIVRRGSDIWVGTSDGLARINSPKGEALGERGTKTFSTDNGLPDNGITCLGMNGDDLYVGTMKGLARLNGETFQVFGEANGLPSQHITSICAYSRGVVVGTNKGWAIVRGDNVEAHCAPAENLPFEWISAVAYYNLPKKFELEGDSSLCDEWIILGTAGGGLLAYKNGAYLKPWKDESGLGSPWVTSLSFFSEGRQLWVGTKNGVGVLKLDDGTWMRFDTSNSSLLSDDIRDVSVSGNYDTFTDNEIMNASGMPQLHGWSCPCATCAELMKAKEPQPCPDCAQPDLSNRQRKIEKLVTWAGIATQLGGTQYFHFDITRNAQGNFYNYRSNNGQECVGFAKSGEFFVGLRPSDRGYFLYQFDRKKAIFELVENRPGWDMFSEDILTLGVSPLGMPVAGGECALGKGGAAFFLYGAWDVLKEKEGLTDLEVTAFYRGNAGLYIGTGGGVFRNNGTLFLFKNGKIETLPRAGLKTLSSESMFPSPVTCIVEDDKKVYVGTKNSGIFVFEGDNWTQMETLGTKALSDDGIQALAVWDGLLYVGTKKGIDCFGPNSFTSHVDITALGAYSNEVESICWDDTEGLGKKLVLWIGHYNGIMRISRPEGVMQDGGKPRYIAEGIFPWPTDPPSNIAVQSWVWCGNPKETKKDVDTFDGMAGNHIKCMTYDDLNLWIGTDNGIARIRK